MSERWRDIPGWFDDELAEVYRHAVTRAVDGSRFVEVGCYLGRSTTFLIDEMRRQGKRITLWIVDNFSGISPEHAHLYPEKSHLTAFLNNLPDCHGLNVNVHPGESVDIAKQFANDSLDFVFLDADHSYEAVMADIIVWLCKVKPGGILTGDDYSHCFPGVIRAVDELLGEEVMAPFGPRKSFNRSWLYNKPVKTVEKQVDQGPRCSCGAPLPTRCGACLASRIFQNANGDL